MLFSNLYVSILGATTADDVHLRQYNIHENRLRLLFHQSHAPGHAPHGSIRLYCTSTKTIGWHTVFQSTMDGLMTICRERSRGIGAETGSNFTAFCTQMHDSFGWWALRRLMSLTTGLFVQNILFKLTKTKPSIYKCFCAGSHRWPPVELYRLSSML